MPKTVALFAGSAAGVTAATVSFPLEVGRDEGANFVPAAAQLHLLTRPGPLPPAGRPAQDDDGGQVRSMPCSASKALRAPLCRSSETVSRALTDGSSSSPLGPSPAALRAGTRTPSRVRRGPFAHSQLLHGRILVARVSFHKLRPASRAPPARPPQRSSPSPRPRAPPRFSPGARSTGSRRAARRADTRPLTPRGLSEGAPAAL